MNCIAFDGYILLGALDVLNSSSLEDNSGHIRRLARVYSGEYSRWQIFTLPQSTTKCFVIMAECIWPLSYNICHHVCYPFGSYTQRQMFVYVLQTKYKQLSACTWKRLSIIQLWCHSIVDFSLSALGIQNFNILRS